MLNSVWARFSACKPLAVANEVAKPAHREQRNDDENISSFQGGLRLLFLKHDNLIHLKPDLVPAPAERCNHHTSHKRKDDG